jgi:predicted DNA-binding transcriptional regulator AlpA
MSQIIHLQLLPQAGFLRLPQVLQIIPVGKSTWWAGIQLGRFPKGVKLGPRTTAWRVEDIRQLLQELGGQGGA